MGSCKLQIAAPERNKLKGYWLLLIILVYDRRLEEDIIGASFN